MSACENSSLLHFPLCYLQKENILSLENIASGIINQTFVALYRYIDTLSVKSFRLLTENVCYIMRMYTI